MSDVTVPIGGLGSGAAPLDYAVTGDQEITILGIRAVFDGTGAAGNFLPCVQYLSGTGNVIIQTVGTSVLAGGSTDASFFPRVKRTTLTPGNYTYYQVVAALAVTSSLVGQWHLTEGAAPYADTSGFSATDPGTLTIQAFVNAMTQNNPDGPLTHPAGGPSVKYNYDGGTNPPGGDYLRTSVASPARWTFAGNNVYTVVAWVRPTSGTNLLFGGVCADTVVTHSGFPDAHTDGWRFGLSSSTLECRAERWTNVLAGGTPDFVSLGAMTTLGWTMVAMSYDGATLRAYANGTLVGTTASAGAIGNGGDVLIGFGQRAPNSQPQWYYGAAAEVSVWASVLSDTDIANLYVAGVS